MENQKITPEVSVKIYPQQDKENLLAFASVTLGFCFAVNGIRVMNSEKGAFVAMPSRKDGEGNYHDICCPTTPEMRKVLNAAVLGEYQKATEKTSVRGDLQEGVKKAATRPEQSPPKADRDVR